MQTRNDQDVEAKTGTTQSSKGPLRVLHLVRVEDIEFIFYDLDRALRKLAEEPEATLEPITVH